MAVVMKGSAVAKAMKEKMLQEVRELAKRGVIPCLATVRLGAKPDDLAYERSAIKKCEGIGIRCTVFEYPEGVDQVEFESELKKINENPRIHGILLFRPLPEHIDENPARDLISPGKDIDCLNPVNTAKAFAGDSSGFAPCTPEAVVEMLDYYNIPIQGRNIVVIGRSMVVGKPLSMLLLKRHGTITICHTRTHSLEEVCKKADILVAAAGKARMITDRYVSGGQVVIDVGINVDTSGNLCGDVDFDSVAGKVSHITPVPGGIGTVTTSVLARHVIRAASSSK